LVGVTTKYYYFSGANKNISGKEKGSSYFFLINIILMLISGAHVGTFYSHGIDIVWQLHGLALCLPSFVLGIIAILFALKSWRKQRAASELSNIVN